MPQIPLRPVLDGVPPRLDAPRHEHRAAGEVAVGVALAESTKAPDVVIELREVAEVMLRHTRPVVPVPREAEVRGPERTDDPTTFIGPDMHDGVGSIRIVDA